MNMSILTFLTVCHWIIPCVF